MIFENHSYKLIEIDDTSIRQWNLNSAFESLFSSFINKENNEGGGLYNFVDEKDVLEITYLILKHAKGTYTPSTEMIVELATKLTYRKISNGNQATQYYSLYNGDMPDFHLYYFLDKLFTPYLEMLYNEHGFNHYTVWHIRSFLMCNPSFIFTLNDVEKKVKEFFDDKEVGDTEFVLNMLTRFIKYFSGEPNLDSFESFQKGISKKPIIRLSENEYILCWHWLRTSIMFNLHYLLINEETYKKHKGDTFEEITASLLCHHLNLNDVYTNVTYSGGEIDVLIDTKDTILLVECKSGILYEDYKLGIFDNSVKKNISSITGKAKKQLYNSKQALLDKRDIRSKGIILELDINKKITLLNICFELPIGISNKDVDEEVVALSLVELLIIIDLMEDCLLGEPHIKNIIDYLALRKRTLGFATDDELTIAISLLYNPHIETLISTNTLGYTYINSNKSISEINQYYSFLFKAKMLQKGREYELVKDNYKGFLKNYVVEE
jgi:Holliday junction resolvase-like predicted endonuclease